jgi:hypothetical protein
VEPAVAIGGLHHEETGGMTAAEPPGAVEPLAGLGVHDAPLDEPPEEVDLSVGEEEALLRRGEDEGGWLAGHDR